MCLLMYSLWHISEQWKLEDGKKRRAKRSCPGKPNQTNQRQTSVNSENIRCTDDSYFLIFFHKLQLFSAPEAVKFAYLVTPGDSHFHAAVQFLNLGKSLSFTTYFNRISKAFYSLHKEPETCVYFEPWPREIHWMPPTSGIRNGKKCLLTLPVESMILQNFLISPSSHLFSELQMHRSHFTIPVILECSLWTFSSSPSLISKMMYHYST